MVEVIKWLGGNWVHLLEIGGLIFAGLSFREETKARKVGNSISLAQNLHNIWKEQYSRPTLTRISDARADLKANPLSDEERVFVTQLIHHLYSAYQAVTAKMVSHPGDIRKDIGFFFSSPIPRAVWKMVKPFQDADFAQFVEDSIRSSESSPVN